MPAVRTVGHVRIFSVGTAKELNEWWDPLDDQWFEDLKLRTGPHGTEGQHIRLMLAMQGFPRYLDTTTRQFRGWSMARTLTIANSCGAALTIDLHPYAAMPVALQKFLEDRGTTYGWPLASQQLARRFLYVPRGAAIIEVTQLTGGVVDRLVHALGTLPESAMTLWGRNMPLNTLLGVSQANTRTLQSVAPLTCDTDWIWTATAA